MPWLDNLVDSDLQSYLLHAGEHSKPLFIQNVLLKRLEVIAEKVPDDAIPGEAQAGAIPGAHDGGEAHTGGWAAALNRKKPPVNKQKTLGKEGAEQV